MTTWRHIAFLDPGFPTPAGGLSSFGDSFDLGNGVSLQLLRSYMREPPVANLVDAYTRRRLAATNYVLTTDFEADESNRDEEWARAFDKVTAASIAIWLSRPCPVGIHTSVHVERDPGNSDNWIVRGYLSDLRPLVPHPGDAAARLSGDDLRLAAKLHTLFEGISANTPTWTAKWFLRLALRESDWDVRYLCLWISLEALFGADSETSYRLSSRLALFLEGPGTKAKRLYERVRLAYDTRSRVVHGGVLSERVAKQKGEILKDTETWVRRSLCLIAQDPGLAGTFGSDKRRREYLDRIVFRSDSTSDVPGTITGTVTAPGVDFEPQVRDSEATGG